MEWRKSTRGPSLVKVAIRAPRTVSPTTGRTTDFIVLTR
jgi:hypothetical protein